MARDLSSYCDRCKRMKPKAEIAHISYQNRTEENKVFERKIIRICKDCQKKEMDKPVKQKKTKSPL